MRANRFADFLADEGGLGTIWSLLWFMIVCAFAGLAIDTTDGLRNRTMLQATADAAALAAAIELPDTAEARATAVFYAQDNMAPQVNGKVLDVRDVHVGEWDPDTQTLDKSAPNPDTVMVTTLRGQENTNPLPVTFLQILGMEAWNVRAQAAAQRYIPECLNDGLIARNEVHISSNNHFTRNICVHGQEGVKIQSNNIYDPGVIVSMYDMDTLQLPNSGFSSNDGLREALREQGLDPRMANHVDGIMQQFLDRDPAVLPTYTKADEEVIVVDEKFKLDEAKPHHVYHVQCRPNKNAKIPSNAVIQHVVIIADCELHIGTSASLQNVVLGSRSGGNGRTDKANVKAAAKTRLGAPDNCADGGGVQIFSNATIHTSSSTVINGVQMVARGDIELGARDEGINGISAQSGDNITLTSNNVFGLCDGGAPDLFTVPYYRLVL